MTGDTAADECGKSVTRGQEWGAPGGRSSLSYLFGKATRPSRYILHALGGVGLVSQY
ncbi:hypothetical protein [Sporisorium scitamineum]|uniref:Uncharacterized protein n=1 Tax=Sporisorium scitamineum TaxID=49012 RepID=A0A0F7RYI8_9BASI|nr:hypothetical protein [Sporisorium scitamineum]